jgi:transposase InsO family protein
MKKKKTIVENVLKKTYYDPTKPGAFSGAQALTRATKQRKNRVRTWLSFQDTYTLHKPVKRKFKRRPVIVGGRFHQFQADLIDLKSLKKTNDGYTYLLTCIDVFSKFAWCVPIKDKTGKSLVEAFKLILKKTTSPRRLQTDKGTEFKNRLFQQFLKGHKIDFFTSENEDTKASVVERFNRTLKERLWRYFTFHRTLRYVEVIPKLLRAYNLSYHSSIKMAPVDVNDNNQEDVWQTLYGGINETPSTPKLCEGDRVRLSKSRTPFKKGYLPTWTGELFTVSRIHLSNPITYIIKDDNGEELAGTFYFEELQKVGDKPTYRIDSILKQRSGKRGKVDYLVRWAGYDPSFDSWISKEAVTQYSG